MNFMPMVQEYIQRCHKLGTISDDASDLRQEHEMGLTSDDVHVSVRDGHARSSKRRWARYQEQVVEVGKTWDWASYADVFTEDATYVEHALGNMAGRDAIREWIVSTDEHVPRQRDARLPGARGTRSTSRRAGSSSRT